MAFLISQNNGGIVPGLEYLPAGAITPKSANEGLA